MPPESAYETPATPRDDPKFPGVHVPSRQLRRFLGSNGDPMAGVCSSHRIAEKPTCGTFIRHGYLVSTPCESIPREPRQ